MHLLRAREFGAQVRVLRVRQGSSLRRLAARAGVSAPMLSQIERGESMPTLPIAERVALVLDTTVGEMLEARDAGSDDPPPTIEPPNSIAEEQPTMLVATRSFVDPETGEQITAGRDHVVEGHELAKRNPEAFEPSKRWLSEECIRYTAERPRLKEGTSTRSASRSSRPRTTVRSQRLPLHEEDRRRRETIAGFEREDKRLESERDRRNRQFWAATESYLDRITPGRAEQRSREERENRDHQEHVEAIGRFYRATVEDATKSWPDDFEWN